VVIFCISLSRLAGLVCGSGDLLTGLPFHKHTMNFSARSNMNSLVGEVCALTTVLLLLFP
jgi:hypothetical protein